MVRCGTVMNSTARQYGPMACMEVQCVLHQGRCGTVRYDDDQHSFAIRSDGVVCGTECVTTGSVWYSGGKGYVNHEFRAVCVTY